jgi:hypothetical protein
MPAYQYVSSSRPVPSDDRKTSSRASLRRQQSPRSVDELLQGLLRESVGWLTWDALLVDALPLHSFCLKLVDTLLAFAGRRFAL